MRLGNMIIGQLRFGEGQTTSAVLAITIAHSLNGSWRGLGLVPRPTHSLDNDSRQLEWSWLETRLPSASSLKMLCVNEDSSNHHYLFH